ncbi:nucleotide exchange factor GrpE [Candidatus Saccharibacteria bacterium]|nr:nucleotide exchange factor GrpE [Candidatus Saccharibacteria bacterium]
MEKPQKSPETSKNAPKEAESKNPNKSQPSSEKPLETPEMASESQKKLEELTLDLQRTRADFENYRKNVEKDKENLKRLTKLAETSKVLPLIDDFDRALSTYPELKPLEKNFEKTLKSLSLEKIDTKKGTEFDPNLHEAVMSEGDGEKELIEETLRPGYLYEGAVLRPAMVKIKLS